METNIKEMIKNKNYLDFLLTTLDIDAVDKGNFDANKIYITIKGETKTLMKLEKEDINFKKMIKNLRENAQQIFEFKKYVKDKLKENTIKVKTRNKESEILINTFMTKNKLFKTFMENKIN